MSWLNRVRNSIPFLPKRETPDNLWHKCRSCEDMIFTREWEENLFVCPRCDHHDRIGPRARFEQLFDPGYTILAPPQVREDPLKFRDSKRYSDRIKAARQQTGATGPLLVLAFGVSLVTVAAWGLWWGGFPQPSELGWLSSPLSR